MGTFRQQLERLGHIDRQLQLADETQARLLLVEKTEVAGQLRRAGVSLSSRRTTEPNCREVRWRSRR